MNKLVLASLLILKSSVPLLAQQPVVSLYETDFSSLSPGSFGEHTTPAFPEYHHSPREFMDGWSIVNNRGPEEWKVFEDEGAYTLQFLGYNRDTWTHEFTYPILSTGDTLWRDYSLEVEVTPINQEDLNGVVFRYQDGRHYYLFAFGPDQTISLRYRDGERAFRTDGWKILASVKKPTERSKTYVMKAEANGPRLRCFLDGELLFDVEDHRYNQGKVGLLATTPFRFHRVSVTTSPEHEASYRARSAARREELEQLRSENSQPVVWKRITTPGFGAARALRLGDLDGDDHLEILIVQNIPFFGGNYNQISCMTAVKLDGRILWQKGRPDPDHAWVSYDVAAQIHDIDDDGQQEVVYAIADEIRILNGKTGALEGTFPVPISKILPGETSWNEYKHYYRRDHLPHLNVDSFAFCDLRGLGKPLDVIIKDRHTRLWAFTNQFELLWTSSANLGHYPYIHDFDNDGRDEIFLGYTLFDDDGKQVWNLDDRLQEHSDGTCAGDFSLEGKPAKVFISGSDDGVIVLDLQGNLLHHHRVGHAQTPTVGQYRPDIPGLEFCNINYWGEPGLITLYDHEGSEITHFELFNAGSPVLPVNWRGDGQEFILLSANVVEGGMVDGWGRRVVMFPEDGHPDMAYIVQDLTGDPRDEIIVWDTEEIWIYTQAHNFKGDRVYAPVRPPLFNESNYLPFVSWPGWKNLDH